MDPLSISATAIAIGGVTIKIYKGINDFVDSIRNAPKEIEDIRKDTASVYTTISNLQKALEETRVRLVVDSDNLAHKHVTDLVGPLENCNKTLQRILDKLGEHLRPLGNGKDFRPRFQWWRARSDFLELLAKLQSDKEALSLSMTGLNTFQTLRMLGEKTGSSQDRTTLLNNSKDPITDPATSLRLYTESVYAESVLEGKDTRKPFPSRSDILMSEVTVPDGSGLSLEERRSLVSEKRQRQEYLLSAARNGDHMEVEVLLTAGTEVDYLDRTERKTALHFAAQYGHKYVAKQLLDHDADIEMRCEPSGSAMMIHHRAGRTPLHWAAAGDDTGGRSEGLVRLLLDHGADTNARNDSHRTPLQEAVMYTRLSDMQPNTTVIRLLLEHGAQINACDILGWTPLHEAAFYDKHDLVLILLKNGANADGKAAESDPAYPSNPKMTGELIPKTPLLLTASHWSIPTVRALLEHGADVNARTADSYRPSGETLLHMAASNNKLEIVDMLLDAKADVHMKDYSSGDTALQKAAYKGYQDIVRTLLGRTSLRIKPGQRSVMTY